jgi:hypothetical protein
VVGSLGTRRESLQQQIEALEQFDREYRSRLTHFMQGQLRALWVDQPQVNGELPEIPAPAGPRHGAADDDSVPAQRQSPEADERAEQEEEAGER